MLTASLLFAALLVPHARAVRSPDADTLRIALVVSRDAPATDTMLSLGVAQGLTEATRAAALFGGNVSVSRVSAPAPAAMRALLDSLRARAIAGVIAGRGAGASDHAAYCNALSAAAEAVGVLFFEAGCESKTNATACQAFTFHLLPGELDVPQALARVDSRERSNARVVAWDSTLERFGADQLNRRFRISLGRAMTSEAWAGWVAMKVLWEASLRAHSTDPSVLAKTLVDRASRFDGHKGRALSFHVGDHRLDQPVYVVIDRDGTRSVREISLVGPAEGLEASSAIAQQTHDGRRRSCQ